MTCPCCAMESLYPELEILGEQVLTDPDGAQQRVKIGRCRACGWIGRDSIPWTELPAIYYERCFGRTTEMGDVA